MSAPPGPRGSRTSAKSRGSIRGGSRGGGARSNASQQQTSRVTSSRNSKSDFSEARLKANGQQNQLRSKSSNRADPNGVRLSSAILSHAGTISMSKEQPWRNAAEQDVNSYKQRMNDLYQTLKESRERERKKAIKDGFLADPDKPTSLANAITPVGTCQDMCPEFERVERIVQLMVDANEKMPSALNAEAKVPCEDLMVKRFRRSAAGYDEQLPSDIRPPTVLQKTLNHLFNSIIGGPEPLAATHKFVWDRTRGIRNDFSIQQVTKVEDLKIAIDCFERIARFHILSLHQLSHPDKDNGEFDHHQEREQLNNTLLSLMYYYDDSRHKLKSANEAEFRAYCVIFEIQDQRPDLEDRAQNWPSEVLKDARVKTALKLYAAAGNASDEQGPLRPRTAFSIAQANTRGFFEVVESNSVSYIMACVAEIYFNLVRTTALESIWKAYKGKRPGAAKVEDWLLEDITSALGFDYNNQSRIFCEEHEFEILEREDGEEYVNLGSVMGPNLKDNNPRRKQVFSRYLVEHKRLGRSLTAVINGLSVSNARSQGLIDDDDADNASVANPESLFVDGDAEEERSMPRSRSSSPLPLAPVNGTSVSKLNGAANPFHAATFGVPSSMPNPFKPVETFQSQPKLSPGSGSNSGNSTTNPTTNPFAPKESPKVNFTPASNQGQWMTSGKLNPFDGNAIPKFNFSPITSAKKTQEADSEVPKSAVVEHKPNGAAPFSTPSADAAIQISSAPKSVSSQQSQTPAAPVFSFGTSPLFSQSTSKAETKPSPILNGNQDHSEVHTDTQPKIAKAPDTSDPTFSFGTSSAAQPKTNEAQPGSQPWSSQPNKSSTSSLFSSNTSTPKSPQRKPFVPTNSTLTSPFQPSTEPPNHFPQPVSKPLPNTPTIPLPSESNLSAPKSTNQPRWSLTQEPSKPSFISPGPEPPTVPSIAVTKPQLAHTAAVNPIPALKTADHNPSTAGLSTQQTASKPPSPDPLPAALDKVTDGLMLDDGGLVQQYVEMAIVPLMKSAIAQFENEESWKEARRNRIALLARKYFHRWKNNAWNLGLMRRGRKQRQSLARSMQQNLARRAQQRQEEASRSLFFDAVSSEKADGKATAHEFDSMPPPPVSRNKRQSLPGNLKTGVDGAAQMSKRHKRKLDDTDLGDKAERQQSHVCGHKRSNTVDATINKASIMSALPQQESRSRHRQSIDSSKVGNGSVFGNTMMEQARRMMPSSRSDTTQTDYFRLKALGIDPDTPAIPLTKKRDVTSTYSNGNPNNHGEQLKVGARPAVSQPISDAVPKKRASLPDDDEDFFASIHAIRSTLADSTSWFQSERQSIERSMTPSQASKSPPSKRMETAAEMRLREIKERGHTPSRSEVRLRAMGDKSLLPKGFWDRKGSGKQANGKQRVAEKGTERPNGQQNQRTTFADGDSASALFVDQHVPSRNQTQGFLALANGRDSIRDQQPLQNGAVSEEVIELSD